MKAFLPITVTDSMLTSSSVYETAPAAYNAGTTYALNDVVSVAGSAGLVTVYKSLQGSNTGNAPASSPTFWLNIGTTYAAYSGGTVYAVGDRVIDATAHWVYEAAVAGSGNALSDSTKWISVGPTNRRAMFTYTHSLGTSSPVDVTFVLAPGKRINCLQFTDLVGDRIEITGTSASGGGTVYPTQTVQLKKRRAHGWWEWLYKPFTFQRGAIKFDIPPYRDLVLTITVYAAGSSGVRIGKFGVGTSVYLGKLLNQPDLEERSATRFDRDDFLELSITPRRQIKAPKLQLQGDGDQLDNLEDFRAALNSSGQGAFFTGMDRDTDRYFNALQLFGVAGNFRIVPNGQLLDITLEPEAF
jgi:hypothetical protein